MLWGTRAEGPTLRPSVGGMPCAEGQAAPHPTLATALETLWLHELRLCPGNFSRV